MMRFLGVGLLAVAPAPVFGAGEPIEWDGKEVCVTDHPEWGKMTARKGAKADMYDVVKSNGDTVREVAADRLREVIVETGDWVRATGASRPAHLVEGEVRTGHDQGRWAFGWDDHVQVQFKKTREDDNDEDLLGLNVPVKDLERVIPSGFSNYMVRVARVRLQYVCCEVRRAHRDFSRYMRFRSGSYLAQTSQAWSVGKKVTAGVAAALALGGVATAVHFGGPIVAASLARKVLDGTAQS